MPEANLATSSSGQIGLKAAAVLNTAATLEALITPAIERPVRLNPDVPFGITTIIGGTNVRFCISIPGEPKLQIDAVKWQQLRADAAPLLAQTGRTFEDSKDLVLKMLAERLSSFLGSLSEDLAKGPPMHELAAFNFSVAGVVSGEGTNALVSTTNTGVMFSSEQIAVSLLTAINGEMRRLKWGEVKCDKVAVMNDAAAGLTGELLRGGLRGVKNGLFIIIGTGLGSFGLVDGKLTAAYSELGHRVLRKEGTGENVFYDDSQMPQLMDNRGGFTVPPSELEYTENRLAGPWAAARFVKHIKDEEICYDLFKRRVTAAVNRPEQEVKADLDKIANLDYRQMTKWAVEAQGDVITAVNRTLFKADLVDIALAAECDMSIQGLKQRAERLREKAKDRRKEGDTAEADRLTQNAERKLEKALTLSAWSHFQSYFKDLAHFLETSYEEMCERGHPPEKIVIGGGIGELCGKYDSKVKARIEEIFEEFASSIPAGTVVFSDMSPEEREAMVTTEAACQEALGRVAKTTSAIRDGRTKITAL